MKQDKCTSTSDDNWSIFDYAALIAFLYACYQGDFVNDTFYLNGIEGKSSYTISGYGDPKYCEDIPDLYIEVCQPTELMPE